MRSVLGSILPLLPALILSIASHAMVSHAFAEPGDTCQRTSDCDDGERCRNKVCVTRGNSGRGNASQMEPGPMPQQQMPQVARGCYTALGACPMGVAVPVGASCYCPSPRGPIGGVAQ